MLVAALIVSAMARTGGSPERRDPWERLDDEFARAFEVFVVYRVLSPHPAGGARNQGTGAQRARPCHAHARSL